MTNKKQQDTAKPMQMSFAEAKDFFHKLDQEKVVATQLGMYTAHIIFRRKLYVFRNINMNVTYSTVIFGFGLKQYFRMNRISDMPTKTSIFYDSEDLSFDIKESEFVSAELSTGEITANRTGQFMTIQTKKWKALISWEPVQ